MRPVSVRIRRSTLPGAGWGAHQRFLSPASARTKILGAIELWRTRFDYRQDTVFNATAYLGFLEQLARRYRRQGAILIQDNASYHKDAEVWAWFKSNRHWLEVHQLPPYSPELNPTERLWQHTARTERTTDSSAARMRGITVSNK